MEQKKPTVRTNGDVDGADETIPSLCGKNRGSTTYVLGFLEYSKA